MSDVQDVMDKLEELISTTLVKKLVPDGKDRKYASIAADATTVLVSLKLLYTFRYGDVYARVLHALQIVVGILSIVTTLQEWKLSKGIVPKLLGLVSGVVYLYFAYYYRNFELDSALAILAALLRIVVVPARE